MAIHDGHVYAALYGKGLYRTSLAGESFARVGDVEPLQLHVGARSLLVGHNPGGVLVSSDQGSSWSQSRGLPPGAPIGTLGAAGTSLLVGTSPGTLFSSLDDGATWQPSARGLPDGGVTALSTDGAFTLAVLVSER